MPEISVAMSWFLIGVVLIVSELLLGAITFFFLFLLGVAALITSAAAWYGVEDAKTLGLIFVIQAVVCLALSPWLGRCFTTRSTKMDESVQTATVVSFGSGEKYRVRYEGAEWDARISGAAREAGAEVRIVGREGNLLICN